MLLGSLQSCSSMFGGGVSNIMASSYLSEDSDMLGSGRSLLRQRG